MARVYSTRFFALEGQVGQSGAYTVPAGYLAVIRDVNIFSGDSLDDDFLSVQLTPAGVVDPLYAIGFQWVHHVWTVHWSGRLVVDAGDTLNMATDGPGHYDTTVSGYLLSLP